VSRPDIVSGHARATIGLPGHLLNPEIAGREEAAS